LNNRPFAKTLISILIFGASSALSLAAGDHGVVIRNVTLISPERLAPMLHADVVLQNGRHHRAWPVDLARQCR
jgi:hypothetical protein